MPRLHVSAVPRRTKEQIAAQIRAQFRYAKFTPEDYLKDQALMHTGKMVALKVAPVADLMRTRRGGSVSLQAPLLT